MGTFAQNFKMSIGRVGPVVKSGGTVQAINVTSTTQNYALGTRVIAKDDILGEAEFIYLQGVASTAAGDGVQINPDFTTTRAAGGTAQGPIGVAMSANVANQYGWYCVKGRCVVTIAADITTAPAFLAAAGVFDDTVAATKQVAGAMLAAGLDAGGSAIVGTTDTTAAHTTIALLQYPVAIVAV